MFNFKWMGNSPWQPVIIPANHLWSCCASHKEDMVFARVYLWGRRECIGSRLTCLNLFILPFSRLTTGKALRASHTLQLGLQWKPGDVASHDDKLGTWWTSSNMLAAWQPQLGFLGICSLPIVFLVYLPEGCGFLLRQLLCKPSTDQARAEPEENTITSKHIPGLLHSFQ